ncbi:hypothetical protein GW17_00032994 [Ensete ventricosum]|nr:hypothetical protein GW17_00032994 [Ensete ventricosum]
MLREVQGILHGSIPSLYSECYRSSVPGNPVALVAYLVVIRFHHSRRPCVRFRCHETARVMATGASTARTGRKAGRPASSRGSYGERSRGSTKDRTGTDELACLLCPDTTAAAEVDNTARATSEAQAVVAVGFARTRRGSRRTLPVYRTPAWPWLLRHASLLLHNRRLSKPPPPPP